MDPYFSSELRDVDTPAGVVTALIARPQRAAVIDNDARLAARGLKGPTESDEQLVQMVRANAGKAEVFVFGAAGPEGTWQLGTDMSDAARQELGYLLIRGQLYVYRAVVAAGMFTIFGADLQGEDYRTLKQGTNRLLAEIGQDPRRDVDRWLLKHLAYYTSLTVDQVLTKVLPNKVSMMRMRADKVREQLERTRPPAAVAA